MKINFEYTTDCKNNILLRIGDRWIGRIRNSKDYYIIDFNGIKNCGEHFISIESAKKRLEILTTGLIEDILKGVEI